MNKVHLFLLLCIVDHLQEEGLGYLGEKQHFTSTVSVLEIIATKRSKNYFVEI